MPPPGGRPSPHTNLSVPAFSESEPSPIPGAGGTDTDETTMLRGIVAMCGHLSTLASQNTDLDSVVRILATTVGRGVAVLDRGLETLARAGADGTELLAKLRDHARSPGLSSVLSAVARNRRALTVSSLGGDAECIIVAPVVVGEDIAGYLLTLSSRGDGLGDDMRLLASEHAAMVCGVVLGRDLVATAASRRARQNLVEGLLASREGNQHEVTRWARHLGLGEEREYYVISVAVPGARGESDHSPVETLLARRSPDSVVITRTDEVVVIAPVPHGSGQRLEQFLATDTASDSAKGPQVAGIGVGNPCSGPASIPRSYAEARRALAAGRRMGRTAEVTAFADLGIHRLLLRIPDDNHLRDFAEEVLGRLMAEERSHGVAYLRTLSVYFQENHSPRRVAQHLHLHPNTVSYRIRRIEEITGLDLNVHRDRLMAEVAIGIHDCLGSRR
ncbi:helix-turn-helix domain-containing protein [Spiractinospora alimapuensis]|uniref:helix-turn-helix domain-containing protein n=1 Tax=Spiractinospora alimapuensis TaxID=2820884 RepID=UPI001F2171B9|nr:helix-turn-helix domain-containing protein [Spiractinospora alimapuensis]QVQ53674.1 helix-turn-helix domain-containing protein [Spiractinospora alimapuensis]